MSLKLVFLIATFYISYSCQDRLKVSLYYEGLCPYCHEFILNHLYPGYQKLGDVLEIDLVPLGNAVALKNGSQIQWVCQHGPLECYINKINACAINLNTTQSHLMDFINCIIKNSTSNNTPDVEEAIGKECAEKSGGLSWDEINSCINSGLADFLELVYEHRQKSLVPELTYVPHIIFNDKFDKDLEDGARDNFIATACKLLKVKPSVCLKMIIQSKGVINSSKKKMDPKKCYFNDIADHYRLFN